MDSTSITQSDYRPRRFFLALGVVGVVFTSVAAVVTTYVAYWNIDGSFRYPKPTALGFGAFWSGWTLFYVWLIVAYFRAHLSLHNAKIMQQGIISTKVVACGDVARIQWRRAPQSGTVVVRTLGTKLKIHLGNFVSEQQEEMISFLHNGFPINIQEGWTEFEEHRLKAKGKLDEKSASAAVSCASIFLAFAGISFYCWTIGVGARCLVTGVASVCGGLWYLWRLRGHWQRQSIQRSA